MTFESALVAVERAGDLRLNREFVSAGDTYVLSAHEYFRAEMGYHAIESIFRAIFCYRLAKIDDGVVGQKRSFCRSTSVEYCRYRALEALDNA